jgi:acyl carrier protein
VTAHPLVASPSKGKKNILLEEVQTWLRSWFVSRSKIGRQSQALLDVDYSQAGWLTSMEVVEFVTEIEDKFSIQFSDSDLQDPRFVTIAGLAELILERSTQTSESR